MVSGSQHSMERPHVADTGGGLQLYMLAANMFNKRGDVRINEAWRRVLSTIVSVEKR